MPDWDKDLPSGTANIALGDNAIRDNNDALETMIGREHDFATGSTQSGRHKFGWGNTSARDAITNWVTGSIYFNTDALSGATVLQIYNASGDTWTDIDVLEASIPRINQKNSFTASQFSPWVEVTPGAGTPDTLAVDLTASPSKWATLVGDTELQTPTGGASTAYTVVVFDIVQGGTAYDLTFTSAYRNPAGSVAIGGANTRTRLTLEKMVATDTWLVQSTVDWDNSIT